MSVCQSIKSRDRDSGVDGGGNMQEEATRWGMHSALVQRVENLALSTQTALLRASLSIFPVRLFLVSEEMLSAGEVAESDGYKRLLCMCRRKLDVGDAYNESQRQGSEVETSYDGYEQGILLGLVYDILLALCSHSKPNLQFSALQTLELWFR